MYQLSATELNAVFIDGSVSAEKITQFFLNRVQNYDPQVKAFLTVLEDRALEQARSLDERRQKGETRFGKLAGVPVAIKDNIHICGEKTTCGSFIMDNYRAIFDASVIEYLTQEDAVFIGKTNLDEFAMGSSTEYSYYGCTLNPWDLERVPGGSSGGSGAAVAARFCPLALGSDTGGSVRLPAAFCGVVGLKPSYGRVSRNGLVAFGSSLDQIGPLATNVKDIGLMMSIIARHDKRDATTTTLPSDSYLSAFSKTNCKGKVLGIPRSFLEGLSPEIAQNFDNAIKVWIDAGGTTVDLSLDILRAACAVYYVLNPAEVSSNLSRFDGIRFGYRSPSASNLQEIYDLSRTEGFGRETKRRIMLGAFVLSSSKKDAYYNKALAVRNRIAREMIQAFTQCNFIGLPVSVGGAFKQGEMGDPLSMYLQDIYTVGANIAGLPAISVPSGFTKEGLPLGFQLIGNRFCEEDLCAAAYVYEQHTGFGRKIPPLFDKD